MSYQKKKLSKAKIKEFTDYHARFTALGTIENNYTDSGLWNFVNVIRTKDETDAVNPVKWVPWGKEYIQAVLMCMLHSRCLAISKSRQIMVSWLMAIFSSWFARTAPFRKIMWMSQEELEAQKMVTMGSDHPLTGRMSFIEHHLPGKLRDPAIINGLGNRVGRMMFTQKPRTDSGIPVIGQGSEVMAVPHGANKPRSNVPTLFAIDEAAFVEDFGGAFTTALAAAERILAVSTAGPGDFADLVREGKRTGMQRYPEWAKRIGMRLPTGMKLARTPSDVDVLEIHYTADPDKVPGTVTGDAWLAKRLRGYVGGVESAEWRREMEIDFDVLGGDPVFPFAVNPKCKIFKPAVDPEWAIKNMALYGGFDYGTREPSAFEVIGVDREGRLWWLWELYEPCEKYKDFAAKVKSSPYYKHLEWIRCDPSITSKRDQQARDGSGLQTVGELFAEEEFYFRPGRRGQDVKVAHRLNGDYWADLDHPRAFITASCPHQRREIANLRWEEHRSAKTAARSNKLEKIMQKNNHAFDASSVVLDKLLGKWTAPKPRVRRQTLEYIEAELKKLEGSEHRGYLRAEV